jgi:hypothetical protein
MNWRSVIQNNLSWKILALALAVAAWFTLRSDRGTEKDTLVLEALPISVRAAPGDPHTYHVYPDQARLEVTGRKARLEQLLLKDVEVYIEGPVFPGNEPVLAEVRVQFPRDLRVDRLVKVPTHVLVRRLPAEGTPAQP